MKLYYFPGSCALAPHIVLEWLSIPYEPVRIEKGDPAYRQINPLGVVPALEHDGVVYTQADAILHWLADSFPEAGLGADETPDAGYALNHWMAFLTGDLHPAFFPFFNTQRYTTSDDAQQIAAVKAASLPRIAAYLNHLERYMQGRDHLVGQRRSIADAYAVPMLRWVRLLDKKLVEYPALQRYLDALQSDPGVARALEEQGLKA